MLDIFLSWFAARKDGITVLIASIVFIVGGFQYFEVRMDSRIERSLEILKRREQKIFVDARSYMLKKWIDGEKLRREFEDTKEYSDDLIEKIGKEISGDEDYKIALYNISTFYNNASACALDGVCDISTMCSSLAGEVQDFLDVNKGYFIYATRIRDEDAKSLTLSMPEFVNACLENLGLNVFSRHDRGLWCRVNVYMYRMLSFGLNSACEGFETKYDASLRG